MVNRESIGINCIPLFPTQNQQVVGSFSKASNRLKSCHRLVRIHLRYTP